MTHTVHPYAHRIGTLRGWKSQWFSSNKKHYVQNLREDCAIREHLDKELKGKMVDDVSIERSRDSVSVIISTARPGFLIGRDGSEIESITKKLKKVLKGVHSPMADKLKIRIEEIKMADKNANIIAESIIEALEKRLPFRRVIKQMAEKVIANRDVKGVRILVAGRLGGAEIARSEQVKKGQIPLQTFRADIDYAQKNAILSYGVLGIKVWVYKGENFDKK